MNFQNSTVHAGRDRLASRAGSQAAPSSALMAQVCTGQLDNKFLTACRCLAGRLAGLLQMAVGKVEVLFPVEVGDIVFSCADVVADALANRLIDFWLFGHANAF